MKLIDYIKGDRKGKGAHRIELDSMKDPLLHDAIEGFDSVEGDHAKVIERLQGKIDARVAKKSNKKAISWSVAALVMLTLTVGGLRFLLQDDLEVSSEEITNVQLATENDSVKIIAQAAEKEKAEWETSKDRNIIKFVPPVVETSAVADQERVIAQEDRSDMTTISTREDAVSVDKVAIAAPQTKSQSVKLGEKEQQSVIKNSDKVSPEAELSEVVVTGYQTERRQSLTGSVATISAESQKSKVKSDALTFEEYVAKNIAEIKDAAGNRIMGEVVVEFAVTNKGRVQKINVVKSLSPEADKEAVRLIKEFKGWTQAVNDSGDKTRGEKVIKIVFK